MRSNVTTHFLMTSSNGNISALLALCDGNPPVTGGFPSQRPGTRSFDVFFDLRLNKRLSKRFFLSSVSEERDEETVETLVI